MSPRELARIESEQEREYSRLETLWLRSAISMLERLRSLITSAWDERIFLSWETVKSWQDGPISVHDEMARAIAEAYELGVEHGKVLASKTRA